MFNFENTLGIHDWKQCWRYIIVFLVTRVHFDIFILYGVWSNVFTENVKNNFANNLEPSTSWQICCHNTFVGKYMCRNLWRFSNWETKIMYWEIGDISIPNLPCSDQKCHCTCKCHSSCHYFLFIHLDIKESQVSSIKLCRIDNSLSSQQDINCYWDLILELVRCSDVHLV